MQESTKKRRHARALDHTRIGFMSQPVIRSFRRLLRNLDYGTIDVIWPDGTCTSHGHATSVGAPRVTVTLRNYLPVRRLIFGGHNGFAEAYFEGHWTTNDLRQMFDIVMGNEHVLRGVLAGKLFSRLCDSLNHLFNRNSRAGSRRNIAFHYDLGNEFYLQWLDPSMTYSSALYTADNQSLEQAQQTKIDRIVDWLSPQPGAEVLEIGCGWGALGNSLVEQSGCSVHGVSLSQEQLGYARQRYRDLRLNFEYQDYRELQGQYDHIVSIEMFEAVGMAYWPTYFSQLNSLLSTTGTALLQIITIDESRFEKYRRQPDFIQRYVFPGGMLPTKDILHQLIADSGFEIREAQWFGESYARTLAAWRDRFERRLNRVRELGYDERFVRLWRYYLSYCETGFDRGTTDVGMLLISRSGSDPAS